MNILLVDADSKKGFPNLALMKISTYHREQNDLVDLIKGIPTTAPIMDYSHVYISCIFKQNKERVKEYAAQFDNDVAVYIGGSGISLNHNLPDDIEFLTPDYNLYNTDYSIGFTSRGCIRKCGFCVVNEKEGHIHHWQYIDEFHDPNHKKIILLDNNFQASPDWKETLAYINKHKLKVNFNSGLDIRLMTKEFAEALKETKVYDWRFKYKKLTFAFDDLKDADKILRGIQLLKDAGHNLNKGNTMFYVLVGYDSTIQEDMQRIIMLKEMGVGAFVMRYNKTEGKHGILKHLSRWVNRKYYEYIDFCDYDYSDSVESYNKTFARRQDPSFFCTQKLWSKPK